MPLFMLVGGMYVIMYLVGFVVGVVWARRCQRAKFERVAEEVHESRRRRMAARTTPPPIPAFLMKPRLGKPIDRARVDRILRQGAYAPEVCR